MLGQMSGSCECGNEHPGSIKCGEFLDYPSPVSFSRRTLLHGISYILDKKKGIKTFEYIYIYMYIYVNIYIPFFWYMTLRQWVTGSRRFEKRVLIFIFLPFKIRTLRYLEMSGSDYPLAQLYIPEERNSHVHSCENLKPTKTKSFIPCSKRR